MLNCCFLGSSRQDETTLVGQHRFCFWQVRAYFVPFIFNLSSCELQTFFASQNFPCTDSGHFQQLFFNTMVPSFFFSNLNLSAFFSLQSMFSNFTVG